MNLILSHLTEKKFDFISLRLLSSSISSHFTKKNPILSHLTEKKSCSVLILTQNRTGPGQEILVLVVSLVTSLLVRVDIKSLICHVNLSSTEIELESLLRSE